MGTLALSPEEVARQTGVVDVREAMEADAVLGVRPAVVASVGSTEEASRFLGWANSNGLKVANVFHAGDGNLHPLVLFDSSVPGEAEHAEELAGEILHVCVDAGGSITGEHGVGAAKELYMPAMFSPDDLDAMQLLRCAVDPQRTYNPDKVFPTPRLCGERPGPYRPHPLEQAGVAEIF